MPKTFTDEELANFDKNIRDMHRTNIKQAEEIERYRSCTDEWTRECITWRGSVLKGFAGHYCFEFDGLPVDETCMEWSVCSCWPWWHWRRIAAEVRYFFRETELPGE